MVPNVAASFIRDAIVSVLTSHKSSTVSFLRTLIEESSGVSLSPSTFYRHISELVDAQVLVRINREVSLNLTWMDERIRFADRLGECRNMKLDSLRIPYREGQERVYRAASLAALDAVWNHIHLELGIHYGESRWYGYNAHAWYAVGMSDTERRLHESLVANGFRYHLLIGNDSFLDRYGVQKSEVAGYRTKIAPVDAFDSEGYAVWAGSGFTLECRFPTELSDRFSQFFSDVQQESDLNINDFQAVFRMSRPCTLRVRRSRRQAEKLREIIAPYFPQ